MTIWKFENVNVWTIKSIWIFERLTTIWIDENLSVWIFGEIKSTKILKKDQKVSNICVFGNFGEFVDLKIQEIVNSEIVELKTIWIFGNLKMWKSESSKI